MMFYLFRLSQVVQFGWKDALRITKKHNAPRWRVYLDIIHCFFNYRMRSIQYIKEDFWSLSGEERKKRGLDYLQKNIRADLWSLECYENKKFLKKWKDYKWELSGKRYHRRLKAYTKRYGLGEGCVVHYDVVLERNHGLFGTLKIGKYVSLTKHVYIDYSGDVVIRDHVVLANGVIIESHSHTSDGLSTDNAASSAKPTKLVIEDWVNVGARSVILETCNRIGRGARIGAGAVVRTDVPPYAIVTGNPSKIVGFVFTPSILEEFEEEKYPPEDRISIKDYESAYKKYYSDRLNIIHDYISL